MIIFNTISQANNFVKRKNKDARCMFQGDIESHSETWISGKRVINQSSWYCACGCGKGNETTEVIGRIK